MNSALIVGESAGAASITAHMLAPGSWHLFQDGILQSGTLDNNWSLDTPKTALRKSWQVRPNMSCFLLVGAISAYYYLNSFWCDEP